MKHFIASFLITGLGLWSVSVITGTTTQPTLPFHLSKKTTSITEPLRADGTPDYVAAFNNRFGKGVTAENNAFVGLLDIIGTGPDVMPENARKPMLAALGVGSTEAAALAHIHWKTFEETMVEQKLDQQTQEKESDHEYRACRSFWSPEDYPRLAKYLGSQKKSLDDVVSAMTRPHWWIPCVCPENSESHLRTASFTVPTGPLLNITESLLARAMMGGAAGDLDGAIVDALTIRRLASFLIRDGGAVEYEIGIALDERANRTIGALAGSGRLTAEQCAGLRKAIEALPPMPAGKELIDISPRWQALETVILVATNHWKALEVPADAPAELKASEGPYRETVLKTLAPIDRAAVDWDQVLVRTEAFYDQAIKDASIADVRILQKQQQARELTGLNRENLGSFHLDALVQGVNESRKDYSERVARAFYLTSIPPVARIETLTRRVKMVQEMAAALVSAAQTKAQTGRMPDTLKVPRDMFSPEGWDVRYEHVAGEAWIYSVGRNGKDDGGVENDGPDGPEGDDLCIGVMHL